MANSPFSVDGFSKVFNLLFNKSPKPTPLGDKPFINFLAQRMDDNSFKYLGVDHNNHISVYSNTGIVKLEGEYVKPDEILASNISNIV